MKFSCKVDIKLPVQTVVKLFDDPENLKEWQDDFVSIEHFEGTPGKQGAKSRLLYRTGSREMELIETILKKDLPEEFSAIYEHSSMSNYMITRFIELDENLTRYIVEIEYTAFNNVIPKLMALFMPGMFRRQTQKWLDQFKDFAERAGNPVAQPVQ